MKASVIIPPSIKPFYPVYTAGILSDILRNQNVETSVIDSNLLFFEHIYQDNLDIFVNNKWILITSKNISESVNALRCDSMNQFDEDLYKKAYFEIMVRNTALNMYIEGIRFGFFDVRINLNDLTIEQVLFEREMNNTFEKMFETFMPVIDSDIIFLSVMSVEQLYFSYILSKVLKKRNNCKMVVGGPYFQDQDSVNYDLLLNWFDCVCLGDAELVFPEIISSYKRQKGLYSTKGTVSRIDGTLVVTNTCRSRNADVSKYLMSRDDFKNNHYFYPIERIPLLTSRECCYGKCTFCTNKGKTHHGCRIKKISEVINEVKYIKTTEKDVVEFIDDNMHAKYLLSFAQMVFDSRLKLKWISNSRFYEEYLLYDNCELLHKSGCKKLFLGLESYNQTTLDSMAKGTNVDNIIPILKNIKSSGIKTHISILFGFPGETFAEAEITKEFLYSNLELIDIAEINCFVDHGEKFGSEVLYDAKKITQETRNIIKQQGKDPSFYNIYKCMV